MDEEEAIHRTEPERCVVEVLGQLAHARERSRRILVAMTSARSLPRGAVLATACAANSAPATLAASSILRASPGSDCSRGSMTARIPAGIAVGSTASSARSSQRGPLGTSNRCSRR
jgi:hypothetical protein